MLLSSYSEPVTFTAPSYLLFRKVSMISPQTLISVSEFPRSRYFCHRTVFFLFLFCNWLRGKRTLFIYSYLLITQINQTPHPIPMQKYIKYWTYFVPRNLVDNVTDVQGIFSYLPSCCLADKIPQWFTWNYCCFFVWPPNREIQVWPPNRETRPWRPEYQCPLQITSKFYNLKIAFVFSHVVSWMKMISYLDSLKLVLCLFMM